MKLFVTGNPRCGKTTLAKRIAREFKGSLTGFITEEIRKNNERVGFKIIDLVTNQEGILASIDLKGEPKVSKYTVNLNDFERIAMPSLDREADLYIIDEIGKMELFSHKFKSCLDALLSTDKDVLATLGKYYVKDYEGFGDVIWLTCENFNEVHTKLIRKLQERQ